MKCALCRREAVAEGLCNYHNKAKEELYRGFDRWKEAYGEISWEGYLERLLSLAETGSWVKEVAQMILHSSKEVRR